MDLTSHDGGMAPWWGQRPSLLEYQLLEGSSGGRRTTVCLHPLLLWRPRSTWLASVIQDTGLDGPLTSFSRSFLLFCLQTYRSVRWGWDLLLLLKSSDKIREETLETKPLEYGSIYEQSNFVNYYLQE